MSLTKKSLTGSQTIRITRMPTLRTITWHMADVIADRFNWSTRRKWLITLTTCFMCVTCCFTSPAMSADRVTSSILTGLPAGAYGSGSEQMSREFGISQRNFPILFWATTSWNLGAALWPLLFVPLTETTGRMPG